MKEFLLFTSAGDNFKLLNHYFNNWNSHDNCLFDIYMVFYGDNCNLSNELEKSVTYFDKNKHGKFGNLLFAYKKNSEIFKKYKYIFVLDNDIEINTLEINFMFKLASVYNFDIIQPSLTDCDDCKMDHWIMKNCKELFAAKVSFIEMNMPLFKSDLLLEFLNYLDRLNCKVLKGFGIDHVYLNFARNIYKPEIKKTFAIIHGIDVINPKKLEREIDTLQKHDDRVADFNEFIEKYKIEVTKNIEYEYAKDCIEELADEFKQVKDYKINNYFYTSFSYSKNRILAFEFRVRKPLYWNTLYFYQKIKYYASVLNHNYAPFVDKLKAKEYVKHVCKDIKSDYQTSIEVANVLKFMKSYEDIETNDIVNDCIIKTSHASGWNIVIDDHNRNDLNVIKSKLHTFNKRFVNVWEKQYESIEPRFYIEELINDKYYGKNGNALVYMIRCIFGKAICVNVKLDNKQNYYTLDWKPFYKQELPEYSKPKNLDYMITLAEKLSNIFEFVRMDFHIDIDDKIYFSEFTFTPNAGEPVFTDELEHSLGSTWTI